MICEYYDYDGQLLSTGSFTPLTKSLYKAVVITEQITGYKLIRISFNWALLGSGKKRLLVSAV